jgi:hypothetical protein
MIYLRTGVYAVSKTAETGSRKPAKRAPSSAGGSDLGESGSDLEESGAGRPTSGSERAPSRRG